MYFQSSSFISLAIISQHRVTVHLLSCRDLTEDIISGLSLKPRIKRSAPSTNASYFSILKGLIVLNDGVILPERGFRGCLRFGVSCEENDVIIIIHSHFSARFLVGSQCRSFYEKFESAPPHFLSSE